ncbi:carbon-nitrogen hydrolase family protein [uncultured Methylobacterium sp.]|uniref:carbon-nitrogen hydrolase family protein n=1 Tax=uncultured Methylobacterium sp. TaxID=157278 RepID=UPI0035C9D4B9
MTKRRFRAAAVQTLARLGDYDHNIGLMTRYVEEAVRQGAELVVFPECMDTGYLFDSAEHARDLAETVTDGPFVRALAELAAKHGIYIASGITEWDPGRGKLFNSGVLFDRQGRLACHYHKQFLATHDQNWFAFGERGCPVVETDLGRIGLLICFDGRIPEIFRAMTLQGAEIIVDMANFFAMDQADMWGPARAYENGVWLVAATKSGYERSIYYPGGSMIVDPKGRVLSKVPYDTHGMAVADVDPEMAADKAIYAADDKIAGRRPETYGALALPYEQTPVCGLADRPLVPSRSVTKVAAVQVHATAEAPAADAVFDMLDHTAKLGAKVLVLPEYAFSAMWLPDAGEAAAQAAATPAILARVAGIAARYGCLIAAPVVERAGAALQGALFATTVLIGPDGGEVGRYRKTHLTAEEKRWATAGDAYPVFDTPFGRVGVMAGFDAVFPETSRCLGVGAADIVLWPAALREPFERELLAVPRAEDNRVAVVLANRVDCPYPGGSVVIPPTGFPLWDINVVAPRSTVLGAVMPRHVDLAVCRQKLMIPKVDMFANRLVGTYGALVAA